MRLLTPNPENVPTLIYHKYASHLVAQYYAEVIDKKEAKENDSNPKGISLNINFNILFWDFNHFVLFWD